MKKNNNREIVQAFSMVLQFGLNMLVPIALCIALGIWLGEKYDMDWIVIPLFFVGALAGYNSIYRMAKGFLKDKDTKNSISIMTFESYPKSTNMRESNYEQSEKYSIANDGYTVFSVIPLGLRNTPLRITRFWHPVLFMFSLSPPAFDRGKWQKQLKQ